MNRLLVCLLLVSPMTASALTNHLPAQLSFENARLLCLAFNPALRQQRETVEEQRGVITTLQSTRLPSIGLNSDYTLTDEGRQQAFGPDSLPDNTSWRADVEASLYVFAGGRSVRRIQAEQDRESAILSEITSREQELLLQLVSAYQQALLANQVFAVQQEAVRMLESQLELARNRENAGVGTRFETLQAEVALANAKPELVRSGNDRTRAIDDLERIIGLPFEDPTAVQLEALELPAPEFTFDDALLEAQANRVEFQRLEKLVSAERNTISSIQREATPLVDLYAGYGAASDQFDSSEYLEGWATGIRLKWAFWDGGARRGRVAQAASRLQQLLYAKEDLRLSIHSEVRNAHLDLDEARVILGSTLQTIAQAEESVRLATSRFEAGKGTQLDVLTAQLQLTRARLEHKRAETALVNAAAAMRKAVGEQL